MADLSFKLHGLSAEPIKITINASADATEQHWLETFAAWMRAGEVHDLPSGRGECRVNFAHVWAVEYVPAGRAFSM